MREPGINIRDTGIIVATLYEAITSVFCINNPTKNTSNNSISLDEALLSIDTVAIFLKAVLFELEIVPELFSVFKGSLYKNTAIIITSIYAMYFKATNPITPHITAPTIEAIKTSAAHIVPKYENVLFCLKYLKRTIINSYNKYNIGRNDKAVRMSLAPSTGNL